METIDQLKDILSSDKEFINILNSLPPSYKDQIKDLISNKKIIIDLLNSLPEPSMSKATKTITDIFAIPQEAQHLYEQCQYSEARELLLKSIELYDCPLKTSFQSLDNVVEFVTKRCNALFLELLGDVEWGLGDLETGFEYCHRALDIITGQADRLADPKENTDDPERSLQ